MCLNADYCNRVKTPTNNWKHLSGFQFVSEKYRVNLQLNNMNCGVCTAATSQGSFPMCSYVQMFICAYVRNGCGGAVGYVVVLLWSGCTAGPVCSGVLVSCCSAFRRASGGHRGDI